MRTSGGARPRLLGRRLLYCSPPRYTVVGTALTGLLSLRRTCYSHAPLGKSANWPLDWHCPRALGLLGRTSRRLQCPEARHTRHSAADVTYLFVPFLSGPELPQLEHHAMENIVDLLQSNPGCHDGAALPAPRARGLSG